MSVLDVFAECNDAVQRGVLIERVSRDDKEYHFQNWFSDRLDAISVRFDAPGRNTYPDFRLVASTVGFEIKGLAFPGRHANLDCNSQIPTGQHNGRTIYYVFGRYPKSVENTYPVLDLVICHGDFLNAHHDYVHKNDNFRGFGSYGDIMVRDRKMYVAPTPFGLLDGIDRQITLILPSGDSVDDRFQVVGEFERTETDTVVSKYTFDLTTNELTTTDVPNPTAGTVHRFRAYRVEGAPPTEVRMKERPVAPSAADDEE